MTARKQENWQGLKETAQGRKQSVKGKYLSGILDQWIIRSRLPRTELRRLGQVEHEFSQELRQTSRDRKSDQGNTDNASP